MPATPAILAIDQGTTSSRAIVFDDQARAVAAAQREFPQIYPADGWVEHDAEVIWATTLDVARQAFETDLRRAHEFPHRLCLRPGLAPARFPSRLVAAGGGDPER